MVELMKWVIAIPIGVIIGSVICCGVVLISDWVASVIRGEL